MALSITCRRLLYRNSPALLQCRNSGYIVLLPDVPTDHAADNALLRFDELQEFSSLTPEKCYNGLVKRILDFNSNLWQLEDQVKASNSKNMSVENLFDEYIHPLELLNQPLENAWGAIKILHTANSKLVTHEKYLKLYGRAQRAQVNKFRSPLLHFLCKRALENQVGQNMTEEQERLLKKFVLEGKLNGMELDNHNYEIMDAIVQELARRRSYFNAKVELSQNAFKHQISDPNMMKNFPEDLLKRMSDSDNPKQGPWTVTLQPHIADPFFEHCPDSLTRWNVWHAKVICCSSDEISKTSVDIEEIRKYRERQAKLLGYQTYADMSMETKMAGSVDNVYNMLDLLLEKARPAQAREVESLNKFALQNGFHKTLDLWDVPFWKRQQERATYNFNYYGLREYFPLETVLCGLFSLLKDLLGVEIRERPGVDTWHPEVRFYDVFDGEGSKPIGNFYLDPFARPHKAYLGNHKGCMLTLRNRSTIGKEIVPQVALLFNFPKPSAKEPCLLTFADVTDLFGKFGHVMQTLLSKATYSDLAGVSNVEWDAVEISNHVMSQWVYTPKVLESISSHFETNEKVPSEVLSNLHRLRRHMAGFALCSELYLARFDLELYSTNSFWRDIMRRLWPMHFLFPLDKDDAHPCSFSPIIAHEWAAAYYSHLWSKVLAADVFSAFSEVGLDNQEGIAAVGKRYRETFLALGGTCHSSETFRRFRGRDPSPEAILYLLGLQKPQRPQPSQ